MKKPVTIVLICLGMGLLLLSSLWPHLFSGQEYWGEEQQEQFSEAMRTAHQLELRPERGSAAAKEAQQQELAAARAHWDTQRAKLDAAKEARQRPAQICFWAGIALAVAGVAAYRFV